MPRKNQRGNDVRLKKIDTSNLPEVMKYAQAATALGVSVWTVTQWVSKGRLATQGFGKARKITKASLIACASQQSKPALKLTPAARAERKYRNRDEREAARIRRCAIAFTKGARAEDFNLPKVAPVAVPAPETPQSNATSPCLPGCRCIRHG